MKAIRLYQNSYSHYSDKVRWALDFKSIPYETITYVGPRTKGLEKAPRTLQKLAPIIEDPNNNHLFMSDSTPILNYLEKQYPNKKPLFPSNDHKTNDQIIEYCLKLDSQLGLYARRLAYLYIINGKPAIFSCLIDGNFDRTSIDDCKSYIYGLIGACYIISRFGIHQIHEEKIFDRTISLLEEIQKSLYGKEYLFNNQFTAADLTLTALIEPLRYVTPLVIKYQSIFDHTDRIRANYDPKKCRDTNITHILKPQQQEKQSEPLIHTFISKTLHMLFYPLHFIFDNNAQKETASLKYQSKNICQKADNDIRALKLNSVSNISKFFVKYLYHLLFTVPKQMQYVDQQANQLLNKKS